MICSDRNVPRSDSQRPKSMSARLKWPEIVFCFNFQIWIRIWIFGFGKILRSLPPPLFHPSKFLRENFGSQIGFEESFEPNKCKKRISKKKTKFYFNASFRNWNRLLFHGFVNRNLISRIHFIKFINATNALKNRKFFEKNSKYSKNRGFQSKKNPKFSANQNLRIRKFEFFLAEISAYIISEHQSAGLDDKFRWFFIFNDRRSQTGGRTCLSARIYSPWTEFLNLPENFFKLICK